MPEVPWNPGDPLEALKLTEMQQPSQSSKSLPVPPGFGMPRALLFGKPTAAWTDSQSTITLDPCDPAGNDNGLPNVTVYVQNNKGDLPFDPSKATVAGTADTSIGTEVPATAIIPYVRDKDGDFVVPATPHQIMTDFRVDTSNLKLQAKYRWSWGWFTTDESGWEDLHTGDDCT